MTPNFMFDLFWRYFWCESAKLRAKRAKRAKLSYVPTCHDMLRANVPNFLMCQRAMTCSVPTCQRACVPNFLTCQRAMTCYMPTCQRAYVPNFLTYQRAMTCYVPTCQHARVPKFPYVPMCHCMLHANVPTCQILFVHYCYHMLDFLQVCTPMYRCASMTL